MTKSMRFFALGVAAVALGACSDSIVTPPNRAPGAASFSATLNGNSFTLASDALGTNPTQYCDAAKLLGVFTAFPATQGALAGCATARDLQADGSLAAYNPGWDNPNGLTVTTGHWVGFTTPSGGPSSDYRPTPGLYFYQQAFTLPTGVTAPSLTMDVLADNVAAVYLNGTKLGQQTMTDCNAGACNWQIANKLTVTAASGLFNAPGVANTLVFIVNDVPTGFPVLTGPTGGPDPQYGCTTRLYQATGSTGFPAGQDNVSTSPLHIGPHPTGPGNPMTPTPTDNVSNPTQDGCENPSGLAFAGTVTWTPPADNHGCTLGFWKTHTGLGDGNQANAWPAPYVPGVTTLGQAGFTNTGNQNTTMLDALSFSGGPTVQDAKNNLMKQAVAALLNAATPGMNYPLSVSDVLSQVNAALASGNKGTILALATTLDGYNSLEGPLC